MSKKNVKVLVLTAAIVFAFQLISCKKADIKFGSDFVENNGTQIFKVDSFAVNTSTVYKDSFITSAKGVVMLGAYNDDVFGRVTTTSYFTVTPSPWADIYQGAIFDSIYLLLQPNGMYYGDTTQELTINVRKLIDSIALPANQYSFYNTSSFTADNSSIIGTYTARIAPNTKKAIKIKLDDIIGKNFLTKLGDKNDKTMQSAEQFLAYFKGIQLSTSSTNNVVINCTDEPVIRLVYKQDAFTPQRKYFDFIMGNKTNQFNNISIARTGILQSLNFGKNNREIASSLTGNSAYIQSITGSVAKLKFPNVRDIRQAPNFAKILKASLIIKPIQGTYSTYHYLPPVLRLSSTNILNEIGPDLAFINSSGNLAVQTGNLQVDFYNNKNTMYSYDVTQYIKSIVNTENNISEGEGLLVSAPNPLYETNFARTIIGNKMNSLGNTQLIIYYAAVQ